MAEETMIKATERICNRESCKKKGYRWIGNDPDIESFVLCELHINDFIQNLLIRTDKNQAGEGK